VLESMALNDSRDLCKMNAAELRRTGKPVPRFCGAHGKGEPDCLMQLMTLTMWEHINIMLSIAMGEARDWLEDPDHTYKRSRENCHPLKFPNGFGSSVINVDPDDKNSILRYDGPAEEAPSQCLRGLCVKSYVRFDLRIFRHYVKDHVEHPEFLVRVIEFAKRWLKEGDDKDSKLTLYHEICTKLAHSKFGKEQAVEVILTTRAAKTTKEA